MASLDSVRHKIFRAFEHLKEFEAETARYYQTNPAKVVRQPEGDPDVFIGKVVTDGPIPARIPLLIGDCLQNLRSSLDYLIWELVLAAKNTPAQKNMFPICTTLEFFKEQIRRGRLDGVPAGALTLIESLQPHLLGKDASRATISVIDDLCNINKHRRVLLTHLHGASAPPGFAPEEIDGATWAFLDMAAVHKSDTKIGPYPIIQGSQGPGLQMDVPTNIIAFIAFNEGATQDMNVGVVLGGMISYVSSSILPLFEQFF